MNDFYICTFIICLKSPLAAFGAIGLIKFIKVIQNLSPVESLTPYSLK
jgi:hypothetical protein